MHTNVTLFWFLIGSATLQNCCNNPYILFRLIFISQLVSRDITFNSKFCFQFIMRPNGIIMVLYTKIYL